MPHDLNTKLDLNQLPDFVATPNPEIYLSENYVVLDTETTNLDKGSSINPQNQLLLACGILGSDHKLFKKYPNGRFAFWGDEFHQGELADIIRSADFVAGHGLKFEYGWLLRCGIDLRTILGYDTLLGEYVIAGNRRFALSLEETARRYGLDGKSTFVSSLIGAGVCPSTIPPGLLQEYCERDCELTRDIMLLQRRRLVDDGLLQVAYCRNLVTPVLADIEPIGMALDGAVVPDVHAEYTKKYADALAAFTAIAGGRNPRSGKQMGEFLYGDVANGNLGFAELVDRNGTALRTPPSKLHPAGQRKTDGPSLALLKAVTPEQKAFKKVCTTLSKLKVPVQNLQKMQAVLAKGDNIVRARLNQSVTQTHRLSSTGLRKGDFQFHNFDRAFKRCFTVREGRSKDGWTVVEADAPQLEFRTAGFLGADDVVRSSVVSGEDVHAFTAEILDVSRQAAKPHTFKPLYGGMSGTTKEKEYYAAFRKKYKATFDVQTGWTLTVASNKAGELVTPWGLRFYWPGTTVSRTGYVSNTPSIFNYPIQSFATADIIPLTLVLAWHKMKGLKSFIINTIHDSIIAEVHPEEFDTYKRIVVESFTKDIYVLLKRLYNIDFTMPLGVAIKAGTHWGSGTEELY